MSCSGILVAGVRPVRRRPVVIARSHCMRRGQAIAVTGFAREVGERKLRIRRLRLSLPGAARLRRLRTLCTIAVDILMIAIDDLLAICGVVACELVAVDRRCIVLRTRGARFAILRTCGCRFAILRALGPVAATAAATAAAARAIAMLVMLADRRARSGCRDRRGIRRSAIGRFRGTRLARLAWLAPLRGLVIARRPLAFGACRRDG